MDFLLTPLPLLYLAFGFYVLHVLGRVISSLDRIEHHLDEQDQQSGNQRK